MAKHDVLDTETQKGAATPDVRRIIKFAVPAVGVWLCILNAVVRPDHRRHTVPVQQQTGDAQRLPLVVLVTDVVGVDGLCDSRSVVAEGYAVVVRDGYDGAGYLGAGSSVVPSDLTTSDSSSPSAWLLVP